MNVSIDGQMDVWDRKTDLVSKWLNSGRRELLGLMKI